MVSPGGHPPGDMECLVDPLQISWCLFAVDSSSHTEEDFLTFRMMKKTTTQEKGHKKKHGKKISQKSHAQKKEALQKETDDLLERVALVRSVDRLLPPPSTEYTAIDKSPNLGIFFFLTRPCENARRVRVERATKVVLWCLFSK